MDVYEATRVVFSRIQSLDPENASKIMGFLLLQDHGEKEMIRLAFGPETLVHSVILKAKKELGLLSSSRTSWHVGVSDMPIPDEFISPRSNAGKSVLNPASLPFHAHGRSSVDVRDEFGIQENMPFLNESNSVGTDDTDLGFGWRSCLYFTKGLCKNGTGCRFVHGNDQFSFDGGVAAVGSSAKAEMMDTCHELLLRPPPRLGHQLMGGSCVPYSPKGTMNLLLHRQQSESQRAAAALLMGEDLHKFGQFKAERSDFSAMCSPASRQIYLTFPAESTFREEDVSTYFSTYGPVQDVRIPYQQKRMFGFVTFVYAETVKIILAKGNPHFVCDSRVLVKPYKEKGKVPDKYRTKPQMERPEFLSPCGTPTAIDFQIGARMLYNNSQEMTLRRKLEEQALEVQSRRLMNLQLLDVKKHHNHQIRSNGSPVPSPTHHQSPSFLNPPFVLSPFHQDQESPRIENCSSPLPVMSMSGSPEDKQTRNAVSKKESDGNKENSGGKEVLSDDVINLPESLEHNLPDSLFASPTKVSAADFISAFRDGGNADKNNNASPNDNTSALDVASFKSLNCQMPRFSSGHGVIGMLSGSGGPTCPVGI